MKAKRRALIILLLLVLAAGVALLALTRYNAKAEQAASEAADGAISLSAFDAAELTQITYTYNGETLTLDYSGGEWSLEGDEAYHLDSTSCNTMVTALSALNAKRELSAEAGEDYGLGSPVVTVSVTAAGQTNTFAFGAENTVTGDIYVQKAGDSSVYTVSASKASCFELSKTDLFGAFNPAGLTSSDIEAVSYTLSDGSTVELEAVSETTGAADVTASSSEAAASSEAEYQTVWRFAGDKDTDLDETKISGILSALSSYVSAQVTDADAAQYGFDTPLVTVTVKTAEGEKKLAYASGTDGYYMMAEGDSSVYTVDASTVEALMYTAQELKAAG